MITSPDPHAVLGIAPGASLIEIRAAYASILDSLKLGRVAAEETQTRLVAARAAFKKLTEISASPKVVSPQNTLSNNMVASQGESPASIASIKFTGQAGEFFRIWIVNVCLSVVTLGIYSAWAKVRRKRYFYGNTLLNDNAFEYLADPKSILKGRLIMLTIIVLVGLANRFLKIKIFGLVWVILLPYIVIKAARFNAVNSSYRNVRFNFGNNFPAPTGRFRRYIPGYRETSQFLILPMFLVPFSLGLLYPYYVYRKRQFMVQHSCYGTSTFGFDAKASHFYLAYFKAAMMFLICMLGGILTIGISKDDNELVAVLAHEIGHLQQRHELRRLLQSSATGILLIAITGDLSSVASLGTWLPVLLIDTKYSRSFETEADQFSFEYLNHHNIPTHSFADILQRIESNSGANGQVPDFISTHPATQERIQNFQLSRNTDLK